MNDAVPEVFAGRLRQKRRARGLSQAELAERVSKLLGVAVDGSAVTRIEKHVRAVRLQEAITIAEVLDLPLSALIDDKDATDDEIAVLAIELEAARGLEAEAHRAHQATLRRVRSISRRMRALNAQAIS